MEQFLKPAALWTIKYILLNVSGNPLWLIRDGGKWEERYTCPTNHKVRCDHQNDKLFRKLVWVSFNVSMAVVEQSHKDSV